MLLALGTSRAGSAVPWSHHCMPEPLQSLAAQRAHLAGLVAHQAAVLAGQDLAHKGSVPVACNGR